MVVTDPLGMMRSIHFPEALRTISEAGFDRALLPILEAKTSLKAFTYSDAYKAMVEEPAVKTEDAEGAESDTGALEEAETNAFLKNMV